MELQCPLDDDALKRILQYLVSAGWIDSVVAIDPSEARRGLNFIRFNKTGLAHISAFHSLHERLGDISDADRHLLYDLLVFYILQGLDRTGQL
jgi:hypothetical protein